MWKDEEWPDEEKVDSSHWDKPKPEYHRTGDAGTSGNTGTFSCPQCGSYNTAQGVYFDECRSCGWGQGY